MISMMPTAIYIGNFGLGGSPFLFGLLRRLRETWGDDFYQKMTWFCEGFNVIFIIQLLCGHSIEKLERGYKSIVKQMHKRNNYCLGQNIWLDMYIKYILDNETELLVRLNHKMYIGTTFPFFQHVWYCEWQNMIELMRCIQSSYNIPIYCGRCEMDAVNGAYSCTVHAFSSLVANGVLLKISDNPHLSDVVCRLSPWDIYFVSKDDTLYAHYNQMGFDCLFERTSDETPSKMYDQPIMYIIVIFCWIGKSLQIAYDYIVSEIMDE